MTWIPHIKKTIEDTRKALNIIKVISNQNWGTNTNTIIKILNALIRSKIEYCLCIYGGTNSSILKSLYAIYHHGLRLATGAHRTTPVDSLYAITSELPLKARLSKQLLCYTVQVMGRPNHPNQKVTLQPEFQNLFARSKRILVVRGQKLLRSLEIQVKLPNTPQIKQPWATPLIKPNVELTNHPKNSTNPAIYKNLFLEILNRHNDRQIIYTDGSKIKNLVGCAFIHEDNSYQYKLPDAPSVYSAELYSIKEALGYISRNVYDKFLIVTDSLSALQGLNNMYPQHEYI
ncbi:hypothetical protein PPYR_10627 [Photinus pyralis]|uniref:Uncharacterized protein n=1 Tax=Photinus pyralis TaxID=7054 RepID=A0A5N4AH04_PHOPY|nr:hypothetical protein PPYR_10627 [Photinus pyralis]